MRPEGESSTTRGDAGSGPRHFARRVTERAMVDAGIDEEFRILVEAALAGDDGRYWEHAIPLARVLGWRE